MQSAQLHLRETRSILSTIGSLADFATTSFYPITTASCDSLDGEIASASATLKKDWFMFNGGSLSADNKSFKKPLFFDIALNYVELDMERLHTRTGKEPRPAPAMPTVKVQDIQQPQVQKAPAAKAKAEGVERIPTPEPPTPVRGGLSNLLGGWWGRK
jgi:signal recognition particle subunit SRP68